MATGKPDDAGRTDNEATFSVDDIPLLTDIAPDPELLADAGTASPPGKQTGAAAGVEVISRVQTQNLEHGVYQKLRKDIDGRIAEVVREQFMPDLGSALDSAVKHITNELKGTLSEMVRASVQDALQSQLKALAPPAQLPPDAAAGPERRSGIIPPFSAPPSAPPSMELAKSFEPAEIEARWYPLWESNGYFKAGLDATKPHNYCILLPPPNVTGTLHMGHAFQHTLMDALTRYHRMLGDNTLWQPGTDHAGIATQIVVERQLEAQGISRRDIGREAFVERVWEWKEQSGSTITRQMRRLGASCDWDRERFTMDEALSHTVTEVFMRLHEQGLI